MALIASVMLFCAAVLFGRLLRFKLILDLLLGVCLIFWVFIYLYIETIGQFSFGLTSFFAFSFIIFMFALFANQLVDWVPSRHFSRTRIIQYRSFLPRRNACFKAGTAILAVVVLAIAIVLSGLEAIYYSPLRASDTFSYHLPTVNSWAAFQSTSIQPNLDYRIGYWPHALHSLYGWMFLLTGSNTHLGMMNLVAGGVLWPCAIYLTLRALNISLVVATACAVAGTFNKVWFIQNSAMSSDLVLGSLLVLSIGLSVRFLKNPNYQLAALTLFALTLLAALKQTGMAFACFIVAWILIVCCFSGFKRQCKDAKLSLRLIIFLGGVLVFGVGAITYWRNLIVFGSPIYPVGLDVLGGVFAAANAKHLVAWYSHTGFVEAVDWVLTEPLSFVENNPNRLSHFYLHIIAAFPYLTAAAACCYLYRGFSAKSGAVSVSRSPDHKRVFTVLLLIFLCLVIHRFSYINPLRMDRYLFFGLFFPVLLFAWCVTVFPRLLQYIMSVLLVAGSTFYAWEYWSSRPAHLSFGQTAKHAQDRRDNNYRRVNELLGDKITLVISGSSVQIPYEFLASPKRKTYVAMLYGPSITDPGVNIGSIDYYQRLSEFTGKIDKYFLRRYSREKALQLGKEYHREIIEKYCVRNIIFLSGKFDLPKDYLSADFELMAKFNGHKIYQTAQVCSEADA